MPTYLHYSQEVKVLCDFVRSYIFIDSRGRHPSNINLGSYRHAVIHPFVFLRVSVGNARDSHDVFVVPCLGQHSGPFQSCLQSCYPHPTRGRNFSSYYGWICPRPTLKRWINQRESREQIITNRYVWNQVEHWRIWKTISRTSLVDKNALLKPFAKWALWVSDPPEATSYYHEGVVESWFIALPSLVFMIATGFKHAWSLKPSYQHGSKWWCCP